MSSANTQFDPAIIAQRPQQVQAYLEPSAVEWLLICFANDRQLFAEARTLIQPHHFTPTELPLRLMFEAMCRSHDQYDGMTYETVSAISQEILAANPSMLLTELQQEIVFRPDTQGLIFQLCQPVPEATDPVNKAFARDLLSRFARERTVLAPLRRVLNPSMNHGVPQNLNEFLDVIALQNARLSTVSAMPRADLTPDVGSQLVAASVTVPTGVPFIDEAFGGQRVGDCNGILGPTGGGKTTLAVHMAVASAKQAWAEAASTNTETKLTVFITAEQSAMQLRPRFWSAFYQIPRKKLDDLQDWNTLTQPGNLDPYELKMQERQEYKLSEIERYTANAPQMRESLVLLDLSGSEEFPNAGRGYIDEIVAYLTRLEKQIRTVFIDYAGIFCERYMWAKGMDDASYRYLLKTFGDQCRQRICAKFNCTTWVLHQLRGAVNKSKPDKLMHHSEAGESADFANNMAICGCLGTADPVTGCRRLNWSKTRHTAVNAVVAPTLRIHDEFALMEDVTGRFTISPSGSFLSPEDRAQVGGIDDLERHTPIGGQRSAAGRDWSQRADI